MFEELKDINSRPKPFEFYTAEELWTDEYTAKQMLSYHLNESIDLSSRNHKFIDKSVEWIIKKFGVSEKTKIADFGCGPGLYSHRLAKAGAAVTGIDFSKNSLDYAKDEAARDGLNIDYVHTNYLNFESSEKYDLIIMIMCDFCVLSPDQRNKLLSKFHSLLEAGGTVLLDVYSTSAFSRREESSIYELNQLNRFWAPNDYYAFVNSFKYEEELVTLDKYTIIEESRRRVVYNWLQYFTRDSLKNEFEQNGLTVEEYFADVAGTEYNPDGDEFSVVARKAE